MHLHILAVLCISLCAARARADASQPLDARGPAERPHFDAAASAEQALLLPALVAPGSSQASRVNATVWGGYDSAHAAPIMRSFVDAQVLGPLSIRAGVSYLPESVERSAQPHVGARLSLLNEDSHGLDLALGAFYRMERFTEEEGLAQALLSVGKRFGRTGVFANLIYAQDLEGDDREGELLLAVLHRWHARLTLGFEARARGSRLERPQARAAAALQLRRSPHPDAQLRARAAGAARTSGPGGRAHGELATRRARHARGGRRALTSGA